MTTSSTRSLLVPTVLGRIYVQDGGSVSAPQHYCGQACSPTAKPAGAHTFRDFTISDGGRCW
jgi:hypothetical protein